MTSSPHQSSYQVQLAVYDLSGGMAWQLSASLLGGPEHAIDIIPHTGIVVFGREYFFGGGAGISVEDPATFRAARGIHPIRVIDLGETRVSQQEFEDWCVQQRASGQYSGGAYDLFHRNCNHFSHDAALRGLRLSQGVPQFILDVPRKVLASPMGQIMQPMLQGMQVGGGTPFAPTGQGMPSTAAISTNNPWANNSSSSNNNNSASAPPESKTVKDHEITSTSSLEKQAKRLKSDAPPATPILDKNNRPLLSADVKTAELCASKFTSNDDIRTAAEIIAKKETLPRAVLSKACDGLLAALSENMSITFGLMLLRLFVLHDQSTWRETEPCVSWTREQLVVKTDKNTTPLSTATTTKSMAWCTLSNAVATKLLNIDDAIVDVLDVAIQDVTAIGCRPEVKRAAASFLYNVSVVTRDDKPPQGELQELSEVDVSLLCGCMEAIIGTTDDFMTRKRCLLVVGQIMMKSPDVAAQLMNNLGHKGGLMASSFESDDEATAISNEIVELIDHYVES